MSRYRLEPTCAQEQVLLRHCSDARYVWNLAVEQHNWWRPGRRSAPSYLEQSRQLTVARAENPWLAEGSQTAQQQALRDFAQATASFFSGNRGRPTWRKAGRHLEEKAPGRVEKVPPAYTSQRCSACGHVDRRSRESQADFRCTACGYPCNADVNAAKNIAAGHAVNARGGDRVAGPANREPQLALLAT